VKVPGGRDVLRPTPWDVEVTSQSRNFAYVILQLTTQILQVVARELSLRVVCPILKPFRTDNLIFSPSHSHFL
jgi:hypothetical protein